MTRAERIAAEIFEKKPGLNLMRWLIAHRYPILKKIKNADEANCITQTVCDYVFNDESNAWLEIEVHSTFVGISVVSNNPSLDDDQDRSLLLGKTEIMETDVDSLFTKLVEFIERSETSLKTISRGVDIVTGGVSRIVD